MTPITREPDATEEATAERAAGMSRRQLIRNAGIAGAAAWTAPMIVDSVTSAAFGATPSGCFKKHMKLMTAYSGAGASYGGCCTQDPACGNATSLDWDSAG